MAEVFVTLLETIGDNTHVLKPINPEYPTRSQRTFCGKFPEDVGTINSSERDITTIAVGCGVCLKAMRAAGYTVAESATKK